MMSAAEYRALNAPKTPATGPRNAPAPSPKGKTQPAAVGERITQEITFPGKVPGNNGANGLLRMHWRKRLEHQKAYWLHVLAAGLQPMVGPVRFELVRYSIGPLMDFDNLVSTGKCTTDALVRAGILPDDNPTIIAERSYTQERAESQAAQRTVIRLIPL
jgi:hypothetical protein